MRRRRSIALALWAALSVAPPAALAEAPPRPQAISALAEDVERLQARIAAGDRSAYATEMGDLKAMTAAIAGAAPGNWTDKREADLLVVYVLGGGALAPVVSLIKLDAIVASERPLVRGALAYVTNHEADALELLKPIDLAALDTRVAGQVAFARSMLRARGDAKGAAADLDWARLLAPGGLVEEAALRRETEMLVEARDPARAALMIRQYADRFAASLYAPDFFKGLARRIADLGLADDQASFRVLSDAAARLPAEARRDFLMGLARAAALNGRLDAAAAAAEAGLKLAAAGSDEEAKGRLYLAAARVFADGPDAATANLDAVAAGKLDRSDAALLAAARNVAAQLRAPPAGGAALAAAGAEADPPDPTAARAEEALRRTEGLAAGGRTGP